MWFGIDGWTTSVLRGLAGNHEEKEHAQLLSSPLVAVQSFDNFRRLP
jgi:hypothetical protein